MRCSVKPLSLKVTAASQHHKCQCRVQQLHDFGKESHGSRTNCQHIFCLNNGRQKVGVDRGFGAGKIRSSLRTILRELLRVLLFGKT